jgi:hypothetical protein
VIDDTGSATDYEFALALCGCFLLYRLRQIFTDNADLGWGTLTQ